MNAHPNLLFLFLKLEGTKRIEKKSILLNTIEVLINVLENEQHLDMNIKRSKTNALSISNTKNSNILILL